jgi:tRNA dimethylallyltransferase
MTWFRREPDVRWVSGFGDDAAIQNQTFELVKDALKS